MFKRLVFCLAVPSILSAATVAFGAEPSPLDYTLEYQLADGGGHVVESGRVILSRRNPIHLQTSFVRVSYISSCRPDTGIVTDEPKCKTDTLDVGNTFQEALADAKPDALTLTAWVDRATLDGMQTIQNDGFATQHPLYHGWSDSKTLTVAPGATATTELHDHYKLTLHATSGNISPFLPVDRPAS
jgi:hypothetical protein